MLSNKEYSKEYKDEIELGNRTYVEFLNEIENGKINPADLGLNM